MPELRSIPDGIKWRLAAKLATLLPAMYEAAFRDVAGDRYDKIEQNIWMEISFVVDEIIHDLSLPVSNAGELADSLRTVMAILFGPDYKSETLEFSKEGAVVLVKRCPLPARYHASGIGDTQAFHRCMALTLTTIPYLNKKYSARFIRTMCTGDRQCELKIEEARPDKEDPKNK
ncbi:MAG: hypothetical protein M0Q91_18545 [Methanoregula sp.]|jgi:hypothetical protein|nr:hypothetical protein [Methanoregula sp.]